MQKRAIVVAAFAAACAGLSWSGRVSAEAALAIGQPADTARDGIAFGYAAKYPSLSEAQSRALKHCLEFRDAPPSTRSLCRIVSSFSGQCLAIALDTKPGVRGEGWAIERTSQTAERFALDRCRATAYPDRRQFCTITVSVCDY
jgi:hypothetical protein